MINLATHKISIFIIVLTLATTATLIYVFKVGDRVVAPEPMPPTTDEDKWTFLPEYQPGESPYDGVDETSLNDSDTPDGDDLTKNVQFIKRPVLSCYSELGLELAKNDEGYGKESINKSRVDDGIYGSDWCVGYNDAKMPVKVSLHKDPSIAQKETDKQLAFYSGTVPWNGEGNNYRYYSSGASVREVYGKPLLDRRKISYEQYTENYPDNLYVTSLKYVLYVVRVGRCMVSVGSMNIGKDTIVDVYHNTEQEAKSAGIEWLKSNMVPSVVEIGERLQSNSKLTLFCSEN